MLAHLGLADLPLRGRGLDVGQNLLGRLLGVGAELDAHDLRQAVVLLDEALGGDVHGEACGLWFAGECEKDKKKNIMQTQEQKPLI